MTVALIDICTLIHSGEKVVVRRVVITIGLVATNGCK